MFGNLEVKVERREQGQDGLPENDVECCYGGDYECSYYLYVGSGLYFNILAYGQFLWFGEGVYDGDCGHDDDDNQERQENLYQEMNIGGIFL